MFGYDDESRQQPATVRSKAGRSGFDGPSSGSLLSSDADDAVARHSIARARRMRRPSPLLTGETSKTLDDNIDCAPLHNEVDHAPLDETEPTDHVQREPVGRDPFEILDSVRSSAKATSERRNYRPRLVFGLTTAGAVFGAALSLWWPSGYVATSEVMVDPGSLGRGSVTLDHNAAMTFVDSQARILRSGTTLGAVVDSLNLVADSEFGTGSRLPGLGFLLGSDQPSPSADRRHAISNLSDAIDVERATGTSILTISARSGDPEKSALIANTLAELFVAEAGSGASLAERRSSVEEAERAVEAYKREHELVDTQGRLVTDDEIARLGEYLSAARARTVELNARAASTREADVDSIVTGSLPEQFASTTLPDLRSRHAELKQQLDRLSVKLGPRHPERLAAQAEYEGSRQQIASELRRVSSALQTELKRAVEQEQQLASQLAQMKVRQGDIGEEMVALRELEREAAARREAFEQVLRAEQGLAGSQQVSGTHIISTATAPTTASGPSMTTFALAGGAAGLLAGLGMSSGRRDDESDETLDEHATDAAPMGDTTAEPDSGKEADAMNPYYAYPHPGLQPQAPAAQSHGEAQHLHPQQGQPMHTPHSYPPQSWQHPAPVAGWSMQPTPTVPPAPPQYPYAAYPQALAPHDPWANQRAAVQQQHFVPPQPAPPMQTIVYVPMQMAPSTSPASPHEQPTPTASNHDRPERRSQERLDQDRYVDDHTDRAIEEIRQSLREFREAIEDLADSRYDDRRFGT